MPPDPPSTQTTIRGATRCQVMLNYPVGFKQYGLHFGLHAASLALPATPPANPFTPVKGEFMPIQKWLFFSDPLIGPPAQTGPFEQNLVQLRDQFGVRHVRLFLMCNAVNWGTTDPSTGKLLAPPYLHPRFIVYFREVLRICQLTGVKLIPSLLDFGIAEPALGNSRRNDIVSDPVMTKIFLDQVFEPLLDESFKVPNAIFAWEIMNEPKWLSTFIWPWLVTADIPVPMIARTPIGAAATVGKFRLPFGVPVRNDRRMFESDVDIFLQSGLDRVDARNRALPQGATKIQTTIGHRLFEELKSRPTGSLPQFHFYPFRVQGLEVSETTSRLFRPTLAGGKLHQRDDGTGLTPPFLGEFGSSADHGDPWTELHSFDDPTDQDRVRERLFQAERVGFTLVGVWPGNDNPPATPTNADPIHLSASGLAGIRDFQLNTHPKGNPPIF
jgi:hypothetical protein